MTEESTPFQAVQLEYTSISCYSLLASANDHPLIAVKMTGHVAAQYITSTHFVNGGCNIEWLLLNFIRCYKLWL